MVQTRTTDGGNSLRRHWLHGEQTNGRTGAAQRYPNGILNHSRLYANYKTRLVPEAPAGYPPPPLLPLSRGSMPCGGFCLKQDVHVLRTGKEKQPAAGRRLLRWVQTQYSIAPRALQGKIQAQEKFRMLPQGTGFCLFLSS